MIVGAVRVCVRSIDEAGFSLLELIVVLGLLAMMVSGAVLTSRKPGTRAGLPLVTAQVIVDLRRARSAALSGDRMVALILDPSNHGYRIDGRSVTLPNSAVLSLRRSQSSAGSKTAEIGQVAFFPDGSSTGGTLTVATSAHDADVLEVEWLTGTVSKLQRPK